MLRVTLLKCRILQASWSNTYFPCWYTATHQKFAMDNQFNHSLVNRNLAVDLREFVFHYAFCYKIAVIYQALFSILHYLQNLLLRSVRISTHHHFASIHYVSIWHSRSRSYGWMLCLWKPKDSTIDNVRIMHRHL